MKSDFPQNGGKVLGVMKGGIGDNLMIANLCSPLCDFTFAVDDYQVGLINRITGCTAVPLHDFRDVRNHMAYDAVVNFSYFLTSGAALKTGGYYDIIAKKIAHPSGTDLAGFDVPQVLSLIHI